MRSGLIVYLVGGAELPESWDLAGHCQDIGFSADRVELVGSRQGFFAVEDAWHYLYTQGCGNINLLVAERQHHHLQPLQPLRRLTG